MKDLISFIDSLLERDGLKLRRSFGVGPFLYNKLSGKLPESLLQEVQRLDRMSLEKKKALLKELKRLILSLKDDKTQIPSKPSKPLKAFLKPVKDISGIDQKTLKVLESLGIDTILDALYFFPLKYEDRRLKTSLEVAKVGKKQALKIRVVEVKRPEDGKYTAEVVCSDGSKRVSLLFKYKNVDFIPKVFKKGKVIIAFGTLRNYQGKYYMVHPEILKEEEAGSIFPVYYIRTKAQTTKLPSKTRQKKLREFLSKIVRKVSPHLGEILPEEILEKRNLPNISQSILYLHVPPQNASVEDLNAFKTPYQKRFIYEDLFLFQTALLLRKASTQNEKAPKLSVNPQRFVADFEKMLPFPLTNAQRRSLYEILKDVTRDSPMNRLLQGDVGSGKTIVAVGVALAFAKEGFQSALMVPTEILARQHYERIKDLLEPLGIRVALLIGSLSPSQKRSVHRHIKEGNIQVVVGTHALIQDKVEFKNLGFVVIDEQHRFGVMQRKLLLEKGKGLYPHCLVMSATPIPRTLALSLYGDLDISIIDELPPGRKPVKTQIVYEKEREEVISAVREEITKGNKAYVVYPLIEESEKLDLKSAQEGYERWRSFFPDRKVFLLHGKMPEKEKAQIMELFKKEGDILVSTTVIEVGVDVPEATIMVVEDAHRFGLSQLHQLRGRVGRSDKPARCFLVVPNSVSKEVLSRLRVLVRTNDGFKVAEEDLKIRGPGELMGVSQSGYFGFNMANLARAKDRALLELAREDAEELLKKDPQLKNYPNLREMILYRYRDRLDLGLIA